MSKEKDPKKKRGPKGRYKCGKCGREYSGESYLLNHKCYPKNKKFNQR